MKNTIRVLLVEDNPGDADLTRETLEDGKVHLDVAHAKDGEEALNYLNKKAPFEEAPRPDLILLDLNLPKMRGEEVLAEIKKSEDLKSIPVVVLTSSDAESDIVKTYALGANCYVTKPVGFNAFQTIVRAVDNFWFSIVKLP